MIKFRMTIPLKTLSIVASLHNLIICWWENFLHLCRAEFWWAISQIRKHVLQKLWAFVAES